MTSIDPAALTPEPTPATPAPDAPPTMDREAAIAEIARLNALLSAVPPNEIAAPPADTDAPAAVSSPASDASVSAPVSSVPPPPVGSLVRQTITAPGQDHEIDRYGFVLAVDAEHCTATVQWFSTPPVTVAGDALIKVD